LEANPRKEPATSTQAAIGVVQLKRLPEFFAKRAQNAKRLTNLLQKTDKLTLPPQLSNRTPSYYLYTVRIKDTTEAQRNNIIKQMHDKGIGAEAYYPIPVHQMPYYKQTFGNFDLPETEKAAKQVLSLPIHPSVTEEQIDLIAQTLLSLL
jgi:perosamine synthetase